MKANDTDTEDGVPGGDVTLGTGPGNASSFSLAADGTFSFTHNWTSKRSRTRSPTRSKTPRAPTPTSPPFRSRLRPSTMPPTITGGTGTFPVSEAAAIGTSITTITATDPDSHRNRVLDFGGHRAPGTFSLDRRVASSRRRHPLDRETRASYSLAVVATAGGKSATGTVVVNVTNVNEKPMVTVPPGTVVAEVDTAFTPVVTFTDPDAGDTHTYSIDWGDGTGPSTGAASSPLGVAHTYAANDTYTVTVTVTDAGALVRYRAASTSRWSTIRSP